MDEDSRPGTFAEEATAKVQTHGFPCRVAASDGGVGVFASRRIRPGEVVLVERPLALTVAATSRPHICAVCLADSRAAASGGLPSWQRSCAGCRCLHYCSAVCEASSSSKRHAAAECAALAAAAADPEVDEEIDDQVCQAIRILTDRAASHRVDVGPAGSLDYSAYNDRLVGVMPSTDEGRASLRSAVRATLRALPDDCRLPSAEVLALLMRHQCNLYGVSGCAGEEARIHPPPPPNPHPPAPSAQPASTRPLCPIRIHPPPLPNPHPPAPSAQPAATRAHCPTRRHARPRRRHLGLAAPELLARRARPVASAAGGLRFLRGLLPPVQPRVLPKPGF